MTKKFNHYSITKIDDTTLLLHDYFSLGVTGDPAIAIDPCGGPYMGIGSIVEGCMVVSFELRKYSVIINVEKI